MGRPSWAVRRGSDVDVRFERATGDREAAVDAFGVTAPHRVLVLDGDDPVVPGLEELVDDPGPVDLAEAGDAVAPPAAHPGLLVEDLAEDAVPVAGRGVN